MSGEQWEYWVLASLANERFTIASLNEYGRTGWMLVAISPGTPNLPETAYFRRRLTEARQRG